MKNILIGIILIMVAAFGFAKTTTTSLYAGGSLSTIHYNDPTSSFTAKARDSIVGGGIRSVTSPNNTGFYYGIDLFLGAPVHFTVIQDGVKGYSGVTTDDFFMSLKLPFGYRWPAEGKSTAFYLGAGPFANSITEWNVATIYSLGFFGELGIQTNKTENVGFHLGLQVGVTPWLYASWSDGGSWAPDGYTGTEVTLQTGVSWRRSRN